MVQDCLDQIFKSVSEQVTQKMEESKTAIVYGMHFFANWIAPDRVAHKFKNVALSRSHFDPIYVTYGQIRTNPHVSARSEIGAITSHNRFPEKPTSLLSADPINWTAGSVLLSPETLPSAQFLNVDIALIPQIHANFLFKWSDVAAQDRQKELMKTNPTNNLSFYPGVTDSKLMNGGNIYHAIEHRTKSQSF